MASCFDSAPRQPSNDSTVQRFNGSTVQRFDNEATFDEPEESGDVLDFVSDGDGTRLDAWLAARCAPELSRSHIQSLIRDGHVTVDGEPASAKAHLEAGKRILIVLPPPLPADPEPENIPLDVVYEDGDIIVINKPAGLVVHPAPGHPTGTLVNALLFHCADLGSIGGTLRPGIVHRLDKDTTGLLVVAKHEQALNNLAAQFQTGRTCKVYLALVHGSPQRESGMVSTTIGRHPTDRKRMAADPPRGKPAVSHYHVEERLGPVTLLRVRIETGRTHQIRVHMSHIGLPIVGDPVYGNRALDRAIPNCPPRQMLHAAEFSFDHPRDGRRMSFSASPPADMAALLQSFREVL